LCSFDEERADHNDRRNVTRKEWEKVRLPGEKKGWKEWSAPSDL
jgi:hypothetical protein